MAKLMKASQWGRREFTDDSVPDNRTIKRWVENGLLMGAYRRRICFCLRNRKMGRRLNG